MDSEITTKEIKEMIADITNTLTINNFMIAYICNDLVNAQDYRVEGTNAYFRDELIATNLSIKTTQDGFSIDMQLVNPVKYIKVETTVKTDKPKKSTFPFLTIVLLWTLSGFIFKSFISTYPSCLMLYAMGSIVILSLSIERLIKTMIPAIE